jgi:predicted transglutaminase-like cysteine proteinase
MGKAVFWVCGAIALFGSCAVEPSQAQTLASMEVGGHAAAPAAFHDFCRRNPAECRPAGPILSAVAMTSDRWSELQAVNSSINGSVAEVSDATHYGREEVWSLPVDGAGDCEDFVLAKRKELIARGWPSSVLLITVVRMRSGTGHAVLTVVTDRGDYVLDNRNSSVRLWSETGYTFFSRQSAANPRVWSVVDLSRRLAMAGLRKQPGVTAQGVN